MARTLQDILSELGSTYDPQVANIRARQEAIPGQIQAEEQGLQAKQTQAFDDILGGARRRGLGFSGIPLAEQARYTSTEFLPSLARLRQTGRDQAMSLEDAILGINERRNTQAQQLRQVELDRDWQREQFERQLAAQERAAAAARATPTLGVPTQNTQSTKRTDPLQQAAYDDVYTRVSQQNDDQLVSDFKATQASANYGNAKDKAKVLIYQQLRPDLFLKIGNQYARYFSQPQPQQPQPRPQMPAFGAPILANGQRLW